MEVRYMRISDIFSLGKDFLFLGVLTAAALFVVFLLGYGLVYKKIMKGRKTIKATKALWAVIFVCYLAVVIGATMLSRGSWYENSSLAPLFYSYKEAWVKFEPKLWRNIILNILMFVPFGFLLPLGIRKMGVFWKTWLAGFLFAGCIEVLQLVLKRGVFEWDDIINNTLGVMIGFGFFAIGSALFGKREDEPEDIIRADGEWKKDGPFSVWVKNTRKSGIKRHSVWKAVALQLPLLATAAFFGTVFFMYERQELGNISCACIVPLPKEQLQIVSEESYNAQGGRLPVYRIKKLTEEETRKLAEAFLSKQGNSLDKGRTDIYDETAVYYGTDVSIWVDYLGGTYQYTDFATQSPESGTDVKSDAEKEEVEMALRSYGVAVPEGAVFENRGGGQYAFTWKQTLKDDVLYDGTLSCEYYANGKMGAIRNQILQCEPYGTFEAISEQEAYEQLFAGRFQYYMGKADKLTVELKNAYIGYETDSKGFYQPVYRFQANINGAEGELTVPALK